MQREFQFESALSLNPPTPPRPLIQQKARRLTELAPRPDRRLVDGGLMYPYPGKGVSGETTN